MVMNMSININELYDVFVRAMVSLIALFLITKLLGKKQVSQMSLFDYVIGISIGNFAAEMTINLESNKINGILAVIIFGLVAYFISYLSIKSIIMRRYFIGTPSIIIERGKFNIHNFNVCFFAYVQSSKTIRLTFLYGICHCPEITASTLRICINDMIRPSKSSGASGESVF